jgi:hypothetical protein
VLTAAKVSHPDGTVNMFYWVLLTAQSGQGTADRVSALEQSAPVPYTASMPWVKMSGLEGLVYEPPRQPASERKHNCADCFCCQMCSDARCASCLKRKAHLRKIGANKKRKK